MVMGPKDAAGMANSVDPHQSVQEQSDLFRSSLICSGIVCSVHEQSDLFRNSLIWVVTVCPNISDHCSK